MTLQDLVEPKAPLIQQVYNAIHAKSGKITSKELYEAFGRKQVKYAIARLHSAHRVKRIRTFDIYDAENDSVKWVYIVIDK